MALRNSCLYEGKIIGIESIYTVRNGLQINIEDKVEALKKLGRQKKLFCPCGCGCNLFVVASPRNLKEQHFRIEKGKANVKCMATFEGKKSIDSKIVLKCWLEDKLRAEAGEIYSRVQLSDLGDTKRKYELTFYVEKNKIGLNFINIDSNLRYEKIEEIERISGIQTIYVASGFNETEGIQYPEYLRKIQKVQGYSLLINLYDGRNYFEAKMKAVVYFKDIDGFWKKHTLASGMLKEFELTEKGEVLFRGNKLEELLIQEEKAFNQKQEKLLQKRLLEKESRALQEQRKEEMRRQQEIREKRKELKEEIEKEQKLKQQKRKEFPDLKKTKEQVNIQKKEKYFSEHPIENQVYSLLKNATKIQGTFYSRKGDTEKKWENMLINIGIINFNLEKLRIEIRNEENESFHIYLRNKNKEIKNVGRAGNCYMIIDLTNIEMENVCQYINEIIRIDG